MSDEVTSRDVCRGGRAKRRRHGERRKKKRKEEETEEAEEGGRVEVHKSRLRPYYPRQA